MHAKPGASVAVTLVCLLLLTAGCDGSSSDTDGTTPGTTSVAVYLLRDGKVSPVRRTVEATSDVAPAALTELLAGPTEEEQAAGLATAIPSGATLGEVDITDRVATVDLAAAGVGPGSERLQDLVAQVVATLTRLPSVDAVRFDGDLSVDGPPLGRRAIEQRTPQILVESPLPGDQVTSPIRVRGTANVFEATVSLEARDAAGKVLLRAFTTATSGTGTRGTFDTALAMPDAEGPVTIVAFESSAEDGRPLHVVRVPVTVSG